MFDPTDRIRALLTPKTKEQATYKVYAQEIQYPDHSRIYIPHVPINKLLPGMVAIGKTKKKKSNGKINERDLERSIRRSKKVIRDIVWCNKFDLFATFTFNCKPCGQGCENNPCICDEYCLRFNPDHCKKRMSNWLSRQQKRNGAFPYLIVPEFHKDDKSIHFHALIKDYPGEIVEALNPKTGKLLVKKGRKVYSIPSYKLGLEEVYRIEDTPVSHKKVGNYVRKYITKDMPLFFGRKRYWVSTGLNRPFVEDNPKPWYLKRNPDSQYEFDYGVLFSFHNPGKKDEA